jgi:hypothetical protein
MTKARDLSNIISGGFTEADIPNLSASKITSGTFADARIAASNVSQHATSFDDNKIVNDISTLALRQASNENKAAYNTNSMYVDVFQDSTGITGLTNCQRNASEYVSSITSSVGSYETGDRTSAYTLSKNNMTTNGSNLTGIVDGATTGSPFYFNVNNETVDSNSWFKFALGSGVTKIYTGAKWYSDQNATSPNGGTWQWQGSNDDSSWTNLGSQWILNGNSSGIDEVTWSNSTAYRYIRINGVSGGLSHNFWQREVFFRVGSLTTSATGSFESNAITAPSSTNKMGAIITYQDQAGTNALNTDIVLQLSADGGSNYSTATMTALPDFATGIKMAKVNDLSVTAGTSLKYKISFANQSSGSKEARIRGVSLQY